jgi:hypothetical protein
MAVAQTGESSTMRSNALLAVIAAACLLSGCFHVFSYEKTGEETTVDPATGDTLITTHWEYEDGATTTTHDRIPHDGNEQRRAQPPTRSVSFEPF